MYDLREEFKLKMYCSVHPDSVLNINEDSCNMNSGSAYDLGFKLSLHPCRECNQELVDLKKALYSIMKGVGFEKIQIPNCKPFIITEL